MRSVRLRRICITCCACWLFWAVAGTPRTARATCGDYLANHGQAAMGYGAMGYGAMGFGAMELGATGLRPLFSGDRDSHQTFDFRRSLPAPRTCRGPNCRSSQPTSVPVPAPERITNDRQAVILLADNGHTAVNDILHGELTVFYSLHAEGGIFHPPRSLTA